MVDRTVLPVLSFQDALYFIVIVILVLIGILLIIYVAMRYSFVHNLAKIKCDTIITSC